MKTVISPTIEEMVTEILRDTDDINVLVGPTLLHPETDQRYFPIAVSKGGFYPEAILGDGDREALKACRASLKIELMRRPPRVVHDFDDELAFLRFAASIWPGEEIALLCKSVAKELGARSSPRSASR